MRQTAPVLIVSASAGNGHVSAGNALLEECAARGVPAEHVDILDLAPRWVGRAYGGGFELLASRAPRIWRGVYDWSDGPDGDVARWGPLAHRILFGAFHRLLLSRAWSACIATHFLPGQLAAGLPGTPPFTLVITDFELHRYWVQPRVNDYFVACSSAADELIRRLPGPRVSVSGIPISRSFSAPAERSHARAALGLSQHRRIALVMGGGLGIGVEQATLSALEAGIEELQVVSVCGRNAGARARLEALDVPAERLRVAGFVEGMHALIAAADVVVTKPGGLTCSETLAVGRPLVLTRAIPGHEEGNVRVLTRCGAAVNAPASTDVGPAIRQALADDSLLTAARAMGRADAAGTIVDSVIDNTASRAA